MSLPAMAEPTTVPAPNLPPLISQSDSCSSGFNVRRGKGKEGEQVEEQKKIAALVRQKTE